MATKTVNSTASSLNLLNRDLPALFSSVVPATEKGKNEKTKKNSLICTEKYCNSFSIITKGVNFSSLTCATVPLKPDPHVGKWKHGVPVCQSCKQNHVTMDSQG